MILPQYVSLEEKQNHFQTGGSVINLATQFDAVIPKLISHSQNKFVFRGVNEAKYKLYNSAQRKFLQNDLAVKFESYKEFIYSEMNLFKLENNNWKNAYVYSGINIDNHLALLSLMQHRGSPAPCIDFTTNPLISLYFAFKNSEINEGSINVLDNYVSIYFLCTEHFLIPFHNFGNVYREALLSRNIFKGENHSLSLNNYKAFEAMFLFDNPMLYDITIDPEYATINNKSILSQNGILLLNPNGNAPVEDTAQYIFRNHTGEPWLPIQCWNINKALIKH